MPHGKKPLTLLHTSDWHIGRTLYGRKRYQEFESFLSWLVETLARERVDVLLVAGDVFDTTTPGHRAQELYYGFLCRVAASSCRHVVIIGGNHDSPSFLNAPKELLRALHVHIMGAAPDRLEDEVLVLDTADGSPALIVCAIPYLRDRELRTAEAGESIEDKERKLIKGIRSHYAAVVALAQRTRTELGVEIPVVATGHLFTAGAHTVDGDGVRELYVGSLAHVAAGIFPGGLDYLALGHLHAPQRVNGSEVMRYSGSPLPMGFGEAGRDKSVCLVEFSGARAEVRLIQVPVFQKLERIQGTWEDLATAVSKLSATGSRAWVEIVYDGDEVLSDLRRRLDDLLSKSDMEILRVKNNRIVDRVLGSIQDQETLDDLNVDEVFERCLSIHEVPEDQRMELRLAYREITASLQEDDGLAE